MATSPSASALSGFRWDTDLLEFELAEGGKQIACSISREALEDAGAGLRARTWQLQEVFDRSHKRIIGILLAKHGAAKPNSRAALHISTDDLNKPMEAAPARAARR
jgi:hypothetical protein